MLPPSVLPYPEKTPGNLLDQSQISKHMQPHQPVLKVIGLGGGGCNAVERMIELGLSGIEFLVANTDIQALETYSAPTKIRLGPTITRGLGAGGDPRIGQLAAEESSSELWRRFPAPPR